MLFMFIFNFDDDDMLDERLSGSQCSMRERVD